MSSDIIVFRASPSSVEKSAKFSTRPFQDICDRIFRIAISHGRRDLAEKANNAKCDDYLDLHDASGRELCLIRQAIDEALADPEFFSWQDDWQHDPVFVALCRKRKATPSDESMRIREVTRNEMIRLIELIRLRTQ